MGRLLSAIILGCALLASQSGPVFGQENRATTGDDRLAGKVQKVDRANSSIFVRYENVTRQVIYDESTKFTVDNQAGSLDAVKEGHVVICRGRFDWRDRMVAKRVEVRNPEK